MSTKSTTSQPTNLDVTTAPTVLEPVPKTLTEIREGIDRIDTELIRLLNERFALVLEVGHYKRSNGLEFYAPEREEALLQTLIAKAKGGPMPPEAIRAIYREIMSAALALEKDLVIAYLGPEATWSHQAARNKFGTSVRYAPQPSIGDVFDQVTRRQADYGVVPIENSTEGAVNHTLDVFMDSDLKICAQIMQPIENNLMANVPEEKICRIYSHPQVFGQCRQWLRQHFPKAELIEVSSTTRAAELAAASEDAAAMGGAMSAEVYGLTILHRAIQDSATNMTRFLVIGRTTCPPTGKDKTSLMFSVNDSVGALFSALEPFKQFKINLTKIESRPSKRKAWEYFFFVDVEGHCDEPKLVEALGELRRHCTFVKILGSYPNTDEV